MNRLAAREAMFILQARTLGLVLFLVMSCGARPRDSKARATPEVRAACLAHLETQITSLTDAPAIALYERSAWLLAGGTDFPTIAVWTNGDVVFVLGDAKSEQQGSIGKDAAARLIAEVARDMRGVPAYSSATGGYDISDLPTVEIVVRDGATWRIAEVYGASPHADDGGPPGFITAYRKLLAARPAHGTEFRPVDIQVLVWGFEYARGEPVPWPTDLPAPPRDIVPKDDAPGNPHSYSFVIDTKYVPRLIQLLRVANEPNPSRAISFNGHRWVVYPIARFRGQAIVDSARKCSR